MSSRALFSRTLLVLGLAFGSRTAQAEPKVFVDLDYQTDAALSGCPSESAFRGMVGAQLGYDPFRVGSALTLVARAHADKGGLEGVVEWRDASGTTRGERELNSEREDCAEFARVMSFTIAVQLQLLAQRVEGGPAADSSRAKAEPGSSNAATPAAPPVKRARDERNRQGPESAPAESARRQLMLGAGPAFGFGFTPRTAIGGRVFALLSGRVLGVELGAEATLPTRYALSQGNGFDQHLITGSLAGCASRRSLSGCLVNKWGTLRVRGFGVDVPREASGLVGLAGVRVTLSEHLATRWVGALRVEGLATLAPWRVALNQQRIWSTPSLSLVLGGDLGLVFP